MAYQDDLIDKTGALYSAIQKVEFADDPARRGALEVAATKQACELARWLLRQKQFQVYLNSGPGAREAARDELNSLARSPELYEEFLSAEFELLTMRRVDPQVAAAIIEACRGVADDLSADFDPEQTRRAVQRLADLVCREYQEARRKPGASQGRAAKLTKRVFLVGGGATVHAVNELAHLVVIAKTLGLGGPLSHVAKEISKSVGDAVLIKASDLD